MVRSYKTRAIVIRRRNVGEADRWLDVYTPTLGRLSLKAKGVRRVSSKLAGHLELFSEVDLVIAKGKRRDVITGARNLAWPLTKTPSLYKTSLAFYVCELIFHLTAEGHRDTRLYRLLRWALQALDDSPASERRFWPLWLANVEMQMLSLLGFAPQLERCTKCRRSLSPTGNRFSSARGGIVCVTCAEKEALPVMVEVIKVLRLLSSKLIKPSQWCQIKSATTANVQRVLKDFIHYTLERQLKTEDFLELTARVPD